MSVKRRTTAWTLSWLCVLVIVYASLYPTLAQVQHLV